MVKIRSVILLNLILSIISSVLYFFRIVLRFDNLYLYFNYRYLFRHRKVQKYNVIFMKQRLKNVCFYFCFIRLLTAERLFTWHEFSIFLINIMLESGIKTFDNVSAEAFIWSHEKILKQSIPSKYIEQV